MRTTREGRAVNCELEIRMRAVVSNSKFETTLPEPKEREEMEHDSADQRTLRGSDPKRVAAVIDIGSRP